MSGQPLSLARYGPEARRFISFTKNKILGQPRIIEAYADVLELVSAGFKEREGTLANYLITGSSGVGKTESIKVLAEFLFNDRNGALRLDGPNYSDRYDVARIKGSPPGYIGYGDEPVITQRKLDTPVYHRVVDEFLEELPETAQKYVERLWKQVFTLMMKKEEFLERETPSSRAHIAKIDADLEKIRQNLEDLGYPKMIPGGGPHPSLLHIDEIEKAHKTFYNILYSILNDGSLSLSQETETGEPDHVSFINTICIATSNIGEEEVKKELRRFQGREVSMGVHIGRESSLEELDQRIYAITRKALDEHFSTPFLNRFDGVIAARPLFRDAIETILSNRIKDLQTELVTRWSFPVILNVTKPVRDFIVDKATDRLEEGARLLKRKLRHYVTLPLSKIKNTEQVAPGDEIVAQLDVSGKKKQIIFLKISPPKARGLLAIPAP